MIFCFSLDCREWSVLAWMAKMRRDALVWDVFEKETFVSSNDSVCEKRFGAKMEMEMKMKMKMEMNKIEMMLRSEKATRAPS